jgi:hypothetical protein
MTWRFRDLSGAAVAPGLGVDIVIWLNGNWVGVQSKGVKRLQKRKASKNGGSGQLVKQYGVKILLK